MANQTVEVFWTRMERGAGAKLEEYQVVAEYFPGEAADLSGPPEKGYPPEPAEVDVTDVYEVTSGIKPRVLDVEDFLDSLTGEQFKELESRLLLKGEEDAGFEREERRYDDRQNRILEERSYSRPDED